MSTEAGISEALAQAVPLRTELGPAWDDVLARAEWRSSAASRPRRRLLASRWALAAALIAAAGLSVGGLAIADAFGPLHGATVYVRGGTIGGSSDISICGLIGQPADQVAARLASSGIAIEWRFTHWGATAVATTGEPAATTPQEKMAQTARAGALQVQGAEAVTGGSSDAVSSAPTGSVVWDAIPDGSTKAFVFIESPDDPNAPKIGCPG
jgi:hypothetical protein